MNTQGTLSEIASKKAIMVVRAPSRNAAAAAVGAAVDGGIRVVEVTFTVPGAVDLIRELAEDPRLVVGAGTVLTVTQADEALAAGAQFLVSPGLDADVLRRAVDSDRLMLPGVFTPTEVIQALDLGACAVKLFPAEIAGPSHIRALRGPLPDLKVIPSGGIRASNAAEWLAAGAVAVGLAGSLSPATDRPDCDAIRAEARRIVAAVGDPHHTDREGVVP